MSVFAVVGKVNTIKFLDSLKSFDDDFTKTSAIAYVFKSRGFVLNACGNTEKLKNICDERNVNLAMGSVSSNKVNPLIISSSNRFYIIVDGNIKNSIEVSKKYKINFINDNILISEMLDYLVIKNNIKDSIKKIVEEIEGDYNILIFDKYDENKIYYLKNNRMLYLGVDNDNIILSSNYEVIDNNMNVTILNDKNYGYISNHDIRIFNFKFYEKWNAFHMKSIKERKAFI